MNLRKKLLRIASENPHLRRKISSLLSKSAYGPWDKTKLMTEIITGLSNNLKRYTKAKSVISKILPYNPHIYSGSQGIKIMLVADKRVTESQGLLPWNRQYLINLFERGGEIGYQVTEVLYDGVSTGKESWTVRSLSDSQLRDLETQIFRTCVSLFNKSSHPYLAGAIE